MSSEPTPPNDVRAEIINAQQFSEFMIKNFTDGFRGTWKSKDEQTYLYIKPEYLVTTREQAENSIKVIRYLTEKGIFFPETKWGIYETKEGKFQLFATTPKLEGWRSDLNNRDGRQPLKTNIGESAHYKGIVDEDSHILQWIRRLDPNFNPNKKQEDELSILLNPFEASHSDNWAWDKNGTLYPIDIQIASIAKPSEQQIINSWLSKI